MSQTNLIDQVPNGERQAPIGIENPAMYTEMNNNIIGNGHISNKLSKGSGGDVLYQSGVTTIRIAGTPVNKRRQFFEDKSSRSSSLERPAKLKENVPNSIKNSILKGNDAPSEQKDANFAITTNIPIDPEVKDEDIKPETVVTDLQGNDITDDYNDQNNPKRKKVSFQDAVVINDDEVTKLTTGEEDNAQKYSTSVGDVEVFYHDKPAITDMTTQSKESLQMNGSVTPIVDELELRQLSQKLSSKEKQGPFLPAPPEMNSLNASNVNNLNTNDNFTSKSKDLNGAKHKDSNSKNRDNKSKNKKKSKQKHNLCLWMAVCLIILAIAGLLVLGILYAVRFSSESKPEIIRVLTTELSLQPIQTSDIFSGGLTSKPSPNTAYYVIENPNNMTWQRPGNTSVLSWHRGGVLRLVSLPVTAGGQVTTQLLGDVAKETDASYSILLSPDRWYAAELHFEDTYCVFSISHTGSGSVTWTKATIITLEGLHASHKDTIQKYSSG